MKKRIINKSHLFGSPTEAIIAVNLECNSRCMMCRIWKLKEKGSLAPQDYANIPNTLKNVSITGGEPFMRDDIADIIKTVYTAAVKPQIIVSTNGFLTNKILTVVNELDGIVPKIGIGVSLDGIGETHNRIRGTRNAFKKVLNTIHALQKHNFRNIRISFTITDHNVDEMADVYKLSKSLGVEFCGQLAHNSELYYRTESNTLVDKERLRKAIDSINHQELMRWSPKNWFRAYYNAGMVEFNDGRKRLVQCSAMEKFFYLSPHGDVYPCLFISEAIGNIKETKFESLWLGRRRNSIRDRITRCTDCWVMCTAKAGLKNKAHKAALWIAKEMAINTFGKRFKLD